MPRQAVILVLAVVLWALSPVPALWAGVVAYFGAWVAVNAVLVLRPTLLEVRVGPKSALAAAAVILAVPVHTLWARRDALAETEGLTGLYARAADRHLLEDTPSVFPRMVFTDHPQLFYVYAPGGEVASLRVGPGADDLDGTPLGHGLFRVRYEPRAHGEAGATDGPVQARATVDGAASDRALTLVRPRPHPRWLRVSPGRTVAAVTSEESDEVILVGPTGLVRRLDVGDGPSDCAFLDERRLVVGHRYARDAFIIDIESGETTRRVPLTPHMGHLAASRDGSRLAVAVSGPAPGVFMVDAASGSVQEFVPGAADWVAFGANADTVIVSSRAAATLERWTFGDGRRQVRRLDLGRPALSLAVDARGDGAVVATTDYRRGGERHFGNHFVQDQLLSVDLRRFEVVGQSLTARRTPRQGSAGDVDRGLSPLGIDILDGGALRVAFAGSDQVIHERRAGDPDPTVVETADIPLSAPHGVATFADGSFAVSSPSDGRIGVFEEDGSLRALVELAPADDALLRESPPALKRRMGERTFYEGTRAGIACQSCHTDGDTDEVLRNIGERRLGPTLSTRGLAGTAPYLRDGSYPRIADLDHLAQTLFRGYRRRRPGRAATLEAFVLALPRRPSLALFGDRDLARERRGHDAFTRAGCPTCHAPPAFTNLAQYPLGALFPRRAEALGADASLDVPSLIGVGRGGPFLMDARAPTLEAVLREHNRDNRHGDSRSLSDDEARDLVFFLEAL